MFGGAHVDCGEAYQETKVIAGTSAERQEECSKESCKCSLDDSWIDVLGQDMIGA